MSYTKQGAIRFQAEWIVKQFINEAGDHDHDRDTFGMSEHATKEAAESAAIRNGKAAAECEWILVAEQSYRGYEWVDVRRWTGDWDGLSCLTFEEERNPC